MKKLPIFAGIILLLAGTILLWPSTEVPEPIIDEEKVHETITRGTKVSSFYVEVYEEDKVYEGTTLFYDAHEENNSRIIEINMLGEIVWEYKIPEHLAQYNNPGFDVEYLAESDHILFTLPKYGVHEIDREGNLIWSHLDEDVSHDVDRLPNGNTLYVWGADAYAATQVKEVDSDGNLVWSWAAKDHYDYPVTANWTHANAVTRLENGNTLISLRNFYLTTEVDPNGNIVREYDWSEYGEETDPHEPEVLGDNLLICLQKDSPYQAVEIDMETEEIVWTYSDRLRTARDCDRLPNGNTLIVAVSTISGESVMLEVTEDGEVVWEFVIEGSVGQSPGLIYKAERI